jgi:GNAT superfamily N-acetyltransferase
MKGYAKILEIQKKHSDFVSVVIQDRWDVSEERALQFVDEYLFKKNNSNCFIAEYNDIPIGMGTFHINNDIGIDLHPWCIGLWVNPKHRGHSIGYKLSLKRFSLARELGYNKIYLDTINAEKYHEKYGWKNTGLIGWYQNEPTTVMEYDLKN